MNWKFSLKDLNLVSYLTTAERDYTPRFEKEHIHEFLNGVIESLEGDTSGFISSQIEWKGGLREAAEIGLEKYRVLTNIPSAEINNADFREVGAIRTISLLQQERFFSPESLRAIMSEMKLLFRNYKLFMLLIGDFWPFQTDQFNNLVNNTHPEALVLEPVVSNDGDEKYGTRRIGFLDPLPAPALLAQEAVGFPGMLFWFRDSRKPLYIRPSDLPKVGRTFDKFIESSLEMDENTYKQFLEAYEKRHRAKKILHISDLHFGTEAASENQIRLKDEIIEKKFGFSSIVITGDLFDNPNRKDALDFNSFRQDLSRELSKKEVFIIPGNHDQMILGTFWRDLTGYEELEWGNIKIDDDLECVFFCFNSASDTTFARGSFSDVEREKAEEKFNELNFDNRYDEYQQVVLIHHHPFTFKPNEEVVVSQSGLKRMARTFKKLIKKLPEKAVDLLSCMNNADVLLKWCAEKKIPLILHGHEHFQRYHYKTISTDSGYCEVTAVGCGTSLGIGKQHPLTYNILSWNKDSQKWGVTFMEENDDEDGFHVAAVYLIKIE